MTPSEVATPRGSCPVLGYGELDKQHLPVMLLFMDAFGPRPTLTKIAESLVDLGYRVLLPDLFYDHLPYRPLDPQSVISGGEDLRRLGTMFGVLNQQAIDMDVEALLSFAAEELGAGAKIGAVGYCMGARYALTAATLSSRVLMAAAFHGSNLALEHGDSVHRRFGGVRSKIYVGVAEIDPTFDGAEEGRLASALREAKVDHVIETYAGAAHGFVMEDLPAYSATANERHWRRLTALSQGAFG